MTFAKTSPLMLRREMSLLLLQSLLSPLFLKRVMVLASSCLVVKLLLASTDIGLHVENAVRWSCSA